MSETSDVAAWWTALRTTALVGTARRDLPPPAVPGVGVRDGSREERLLDAAALGDAVRRAGRRPVAADGATAEPAATEDHPAAGDQATQLLALLLHQPPVSPAQRQGLLAHWLTCARGARRVVPHHLLPDLLTEAGRDPALRSLVPAVCGQRGQWLAALNPDWSWSLAGVVDLADDRPDADTWARGGPEQRARALQRLRRVDPAAGLDLLSSTWSDEPASARATLVAMLAEGLSPADEAFLEAALDDRSTQVRAEVQRLLDGLPTSARAARVAERLRPLLQVRGSLRRTIEVELPAEEPDAAATRDGVGTRAGASQRAAWLRAMVAGAPLSLWTEVSGRDPARTVAMLGGPALDVVLDGLRAAALRQRDVEWSRALLARAADVTLLSVLPREEREATVAAAVRRAPVAEVARTLLHLETPWGEELSDAVVARLRRDKDAAHAVRVLRDVLPDALHPAVVPRVESWLGSHDPDGDRVLRSVLRDTVQLHSLRTSISEALR